MSQKFNPDIDEKLKIYENEYKKQHNGVFSNEYYKGITNQPIAKVESIDDLKIKIEKPDLNLIEAAYEKRLLEMEMQDKFLNLFLSQSQNLFLSRRPNRQMHSKLFLNR